MVSELPKGKAVGSCLIAVPGMPWPLANPTIVKLVKGHHQQIEVSKTSTIHQSQTDKQSRSKLPCTRMTGSSMRYLT